MRGQIVNYLTVGVVTAGGRDGVSASPADYGVWGSVVSSPSEVRGRAEKRVLEYLELEKAHLGRV